MDDERRPGGRPAGSWAILVMATFSVVVLPVSGRSQQVLPPTDQPLSLRQVVQIALRESPRIGAAAERVEAARNGLTAARLERFPKVFASGDYLFSPLEEKRLVPRARLGEFDIIEDGQRRPNLEQWFHTNIYSLGVAATLPLFTGFRIENQIGLADRTLDAARDLRGETENQLLLDLARAFYDVLRFKKVVEASEKAVESLEESRRRVELQLEVGRAAQIDLFRINTRLANVRQGLIRARIELEVALNRLKTLMGIEVTQELDVSGPFEFIPAEYELEEVLKAALESRPAYRSALAQVGAEGKRVGVEASQYWPQLHLGAGFRASRGEDADTWVEDAVLTTVLSFNALDPTLPFRVGRAKARLGQAREELRDLRLRIQLEAQTGLLNLGEAGERVMVAEASLREAEEALRIEELKLETGRGVINDLLDAQAELLQAEVNLANALADHNTAHIALQKAVGVIEIPE